MAPVGAPRVGTTVVGQTLERRQPLKAKQASIADRFHAHTEEGDELLRLVLDKLPRVRWSVEGKGERRVLDAAGLRGVVVPAVDSHGRWGLAFYATNKPHGHFKRRRVASASCDRWLPLPLAWALIHGHGSADLTPEEMGQWAQRLIKALGPREVPKIRATLQALPDPRKPGSAARWLDLFGVQHADVKRRLPAKQEVLMFVVYRWLRGRWSRRGVNQIVVASDAFVAEHVVKHASEDFAQASPVAQRERVRRALAQLESAGLIVAVLAVGEQRDEAGTRTRSSFYGYMAATGVPGEGRQQRINVRAPLLALRRLTGGYKTRDRRA